MHATVSRGCPGEPDDPICTPAAGERRQISLADRVADNRAVVAKAPRTGQDITAQLSLHPLGVGHHMDEIRGCIAVLKGSGTCERSKTFCTALRGDAGPVFASPTRAFTDFGAEAGHLAMDVTVSANAPSGRCC